MSAEKYFAVTIDLDTLAEDLAAAGGPAGELRRLSYESAMPRLLELLDKNGLKATFFAVASHLEDPACAAMLKLASRAGHEVASHGLDHDRALPLKSTAEIIDELARAAAIIEGVAGARPGGFRSPGAVVTDNLVSALESSGYAYDSSYNPSFIYNLSKKVYSFMNGKALPAQGRVAGAGGDGIFRLGGLTEFPVTVSGLMTLPLMNYFMMGLGNLGLGAVRRACAGKDFVNYIIHDHELLCEKDLPGPGASAGMTGKYLKTGLSGRMAFIGSALKTLNEGGRVLPLREIAANYKPEAAAV